LGIDSLDREGRSVVLKFRPQTKMEPARLVSLVRERPDLTLVPPAALRLTLEEPGGGAQGPQAIARKGGGRAPLAPSWWTARARTGEVTPGFTKADILRPAKDDPRAPGGVLEQIGSLLSELLDRM
jgi:hypothetical protein